MRLFVVVHGLNEITIPESVTFVDQGICSSCDKNIKIYVKGKKEKAESWNKYWNSLDSFGKQNATVYWDN